MKEIIVILILIVKFILTKKYDPTWDSLESRPLPEWYDRDKFGIFIHWGVFSVPARGEWFWSNWKTGSLPDIRFMENNYKPNFTYQDFARDFTAQYYNATEWAELFDKSGARYVVLTSKHHEGYTLWPSKYSFSWNSVDVGPHRDLIAPLAYAIRNHTKLKFGLYHSLYEWFNPLYLDDKAKHFITNSFVTFKIIPELYELVNTYFPEIIWSDGEWEANDDYWTSKEFIAWLYNESPVKDTVVVNDRWGSNTLCKHGGFLTCTDRFNPGKLQKRKWENAMTIDKRTWGYRGNYVLSDFLTSQQLIEALVTTVSCGGNLLLNVAPNSDGKIPPIFEERLLDIGDWLKINAEAIFETKPWSQCQNDTLTPHIWFTSKSDAIYATFYRWPLTGKLQLKCIHSLENIKDIELLGFSNKLKWSRTNDTVEVQLPDKAHVLSNWAWCLKTVYEQTSVNESFYTYNK